MFDGFGVKLVGKEYLTHLIKSLQNYYENDIDITGSQYCCVKMDWDYLERTIEISIHTFVPDKLNEFNY